MSNLSIAAPAVALLAALLPGPAQAQVVNPRVGGAAPAPTVSPYINLLRNPNAPALNYYGLIRPQFQTTAGLQSLQQQFVLGQAGPLAGSEPADSVLVTGHAAAFMNYGGYFQSSVGGAQPARLGPAISPRPATSTPAPARLPAPGPR